MLKYFGLKCFWFCIFLLESAFCIRRILKTHLCSTRFCPMQSSVSQKDKLHFLSHTFFFSQNQKLTGTNVFSDETYRRCTRKPDIERKHLVFKILFLLCNVILIICMSRYSSNFYWVACLLHGVLIWEFTMHLCTLSSHFSYVHKILGLPSNIVASMYQKFI